MYNKVSFARDVAKYKEKGAQEFSDQMPTLLIRCKRSQCSSSFLYWVSALCMDLKRFDDSIDVLLLCEKRFGLTDVGYNNLGYSYEELGNNNKAYEAYKKSLERNKTNIVSLRSAAFLAIELRKDLEAVALTRELCKAYPAEKKYALWYTIALYNADLWRDVVKFVDSRKHKYGASEKLLNVRKAAVRKTGSC